MAGILHRDLKAENIMLVDQKSGGVRGVIMDFGLAGFDMQDEAGVEHGSGFSGTVAYAAPERIAGGRATPASDVYSLGLIAHEMLTNQRPIPGVAGARLADGASAPGRLGEVDPARDPPRSRRFGSRTAPRWRRRCARWRAHAKRGSRGDAVRSRWPRSRRRR